MAGMATSPPPEARLIEEAREARGLSQNRAAEIAEISGNRWRQLVGGTWPTSTPKVVATIARMARAVDVKPDAMREAGREDIATAMEGLAQADDTSSRGADPLTAPGEDTSSPPADRPPVGTGHISGPPLLHPHEEMWWKPTPPDWPGKPGIDYTYRWTNPSPGEGPESVQSSKAMGLDRPFGDVIAWFRYWMRETHGVSDGDDG